MLWKQYDFNQNNSDLINYKPIHKFNAYYFYIEEEEVGIFLNCDRNKTDVYKNPKNVWICSVLLTMQLKIL